MQKYEAFTLIEMLLTICLFALVVAFSQPILLPALYSNSLNTAQHSVVTSLRLAQMNSMARIGNSQWGVKVLSNQVIVFKGATYATRDTTYDSVTTLDGWVVTSGVNEVVYSQIDGTPNNTGTITLTINNLSRSITLNTKNGISY